MMHIMPVGLLSAPAVGESRVHPGPATVAGVGTVDNHGRAIAAPAVAIGRTLAGDEVAKGRSSGIGPTKVAASDQRLVDDQSLNAPACTVQYPSLLIGYRTRPSWQVAGVDYCVGYARSTVLKDPATISTPGVSADRGRKTVTIAGDNVTLDGYDFSLNGGWGVVVQGANTTIRSSNFSVGSNGLAPILATFDASDLTVTRSSISGGRNAAVGGLIEFRGTGTLTVRHSWLKDAGGDLIQMHTNGKAATAVIENNLLENAGMAPGAHGDYTQFIDGPYNATIRFNTTVQNGGTTQGIMVEPGGAIVVGEIGYNTFTAKGGGINVYTGVTVAEISDTFTVHNNYFDPTGTLVGLSVGGIRGGANDASAKSVYTNNVNMITGAVVQDESAAATFPHR